MKIIKNLNRIQCLKKLMYSFKLFKLLEIQIMKVAKNQLLEMCKWHKNNYCKTVSRKAPENL